MKIIIVDYGLGNLTSILNMHRRLGIDAAVTGDQKKITQAEKLLLPGVGHFAKGMAYLRESGLQSLLNKKVLKEGTPILGICLGAQLMTGFSEEGMCEGLGWVKGRTIRFTDEQTLNQKIPHMGWSELQLQNTSPLWEGLTDTCRFYHVHSYHMVIEKQEEISATALYGLPFVSAFRREHIYGVQFHPEKSHRFGMKILENFAKL